MLDLRITASVAALLLLLVGSACTPDPGPAADEEECSDGLASCDGTCVDLDASASDCGSCGNRCAAGSACSLGTCACQQGLTACGDVCTNVQEDRENCGVCGEICAEGLVCSLGVCSEGCAEGLTECSGSCPDPNTSLAHCGACDSPCAAGQGCSGGTCGCPEGQESCSGTCTDTSVSVLHCGACDVPCEEGQTCVLGSCESSGQVDCEAASDECPFEGGITHACKTRFALGINYAWHNFGADFGGIAAWAQHGVSQDEAAFDADLAEMKASGASVVRWWLWPDFRGDGVVFDEANDPTGLSAGAVADLQKALELADKNDLYLVLTPFSFDNFRPTHETGGLTIRGLSEIVRTTERRGKLMENVVRPMAETVAASQYADRLLGWDVINEPEWAVSPEGGAGSNDFTPNAELDDVSLTEMKTFISEALAVLRDETPQAQLSVGWAAAKWSWAFSDLSNIDFHQPHIYGWVNQYWPYTMSPAELGYTGKPTVMGELFLEEMPFSGSGDNSTLSQILQAFYDGGYAGAWPWQHYDYGQNLGLLQTFATETGCTVSY